MSHSNHNDETAKLKGTAALEVSNVSLRFGGVSVLSEVSLTVEHASVTGLIGPNGAGKTSLFNVISGLQRPNHGKILLGGADVTRMRSNRRARLGLARTFQRLEIFASLSVAENISVGFDTRARSLRKRPNLPRSKNTRDGLLERVGVSAFADRQSATLTLATARLVELARALSISPCVLLLDEPCSGLDENETNSLGNLLTELAREGLAILLVEHDTTLVFSVCTRIHVLDFGGIIASGTPDEIRGNPTVQAAYLGAPPKQTTTTEPSSP